MTPDTALTIPGATLRAQRSGYGILIQDVAAKLGHHRNTIRAWENDPAVDVRRQRLYLAAIREIARESA